MATDKVVTHHVPVGLSVAMTLNAASNRLTVAFTGSAASHLKANDVMDLTFTFQNSAFLYSAASAVDSYERSDLAIDFRDPPVISYAPAGFAEAAFNDGSIGNTVLFTLTGDTFTNIASFTEGQHYTVSGVPMGLGFALQDLNSTQVTARLTGNASPHDSGANSTIALSFLNPAFANVTVDRLVGASASLPVTFNNPPLLTYSDNTFRESNNGAIVTIITITLSSATGETFAGSDGNDFALLNWVTMSTLPNNLVAVVTRVSSTVLNVTLTGTAVNHASVNNVSGRTLTFHDGAFTKAKASQVQNYTKSDLRIEFRDSTLHANVVPYQESFESYLNGFLLTGNQGWSPDGVGVVTSETAIVTALTNSFSQFPISTSHSRVLRLNDEVSDEVLSDAGGLLYSDMMLYVTPRDQAPVGSTNYQFAMYVDTNQHFVVWHHDTSAQPTNVWVTLADGPTVATGAWHRVTVVQDQTHFRYQLYLDGAHEPATNAAGYAWRTGTGHPGSWFNMVNTNGYLSRMRLQGIHPTCPGYTDDLLITTQRPDFVQAPPTVAIPAAANPATTGGTNAELTVLGADADGGEANLTYTWSQVSGSGGVTFSTNANNAAKTTTVTFAQSGVYGFQVDITDQDGLAATNCPVSVTVTQTLTTFTVTPASAWLYPGATQKFTASGAADQFGIPMTGVASAYTWSAGGAGTINTGTDVATLRAGATPGTYVGTCSYGVATSTASLIVVDELFWDGTASDWLTAHWSLPTGGLAAAVVGGRYAVTNGTASTTATPFPNAPLRIGTGGTLSVAASATADGTVTLAGGTVACAGNYTLTGANGLVAAAGTSTVSVATANALTLMSQVTGVGALRKSGGGALILIGANPYSGGTVISDGMLLVNGSLNATSLVTVASGSTLGGTGTMGVVANSGTLSPGNGAAMGLLTTSNMLLSAGCTIAFDLGATNTASIATNSDSVTVNGDLTLGGGTIDITADAGFGLGTYTLFSYGSFSGSTLPAIPVSLLPEYNLTVVNDITARKILLQVAIASRGTVFKFR